MKLQEKQLKVFFFSFSKSFSPTFQRWTMMMKLQNAYSNYSRISPWNIICCSIMFSSKLFSRKFPSCLHLWNDSLRFLLVFFLFPLLLKLLSRIFPSSQIIPFILFSRIFAKYRMITRWGNMSFVIYDYYFLFYLIAGWIIMLKNGKRESLNSFKSCKFSLFIHTITAKLQHIFSYYN